ncbi:MAG: ABC transporter ATP-binding protein [Acidimicrobiia bacterium]|nr:ABC transporter ATP-binding protein [Acidimicrobiia bacterium]
MAGPAIETERLTKSYGRARGIVEVDLVVPRGEVFGFLGPNGAGKTTTIRVLLDFLRPTSGRARVLGLDSRDDSVEIRRRVGYLPGDPAFYPRLTGRELLAWLARMRGGVDQEVIDGLADRLGLDLGRTLRALSRGNRQKVAVVQAFMHRPDVLVLDEPTAGLDPLVRLEVARMVREASEEGRSVFLSSHVLDEVQDLCDQVGIIREGRLVAVERVGDLRARSLRTVTLRFAQPVDPAPFRALPNVRDVTAADTTLHLRIGGSPDALVKLAARHEVLDLVSEPADLEETFLTYYRGDGHAS